VGIYEYMFGEKTEDDLEATEKGMSYGELILDNVIGLDNEYDSFGEKLGRQINEDEIGFLKDTAKGMYEGAKDFVKAPIETTKEVVTDVVTGTKDLFTKSLDERLMEMFGVTYEEATSNQVNQAMENRLGDAVTASALVPAVGVVSLGTRTLANAIPEIEIDANTLGSNLGNIKFKKDKIDDSELNEETTDTLNEELMSVEAYKQANMGNNGAPPINTVKGYKLFRINRETGELFPLYVDADTPIPQGEWVDAIAGELVDGKVKSSIGKLAYRPGFHSAQIPWVNHIGTKHPISKETFERLKAEGANNLLMENKKSGTKYYERLRDDDTVWAEVEHPNDVDWQSVANSRARIKKDGTPEAKSAHITDQIPVGGHYLYNTKSGNPNQWLIAGSMKINRILDDAEVEVINKDAGVLGSDMPRTPYSEKVSATVATQTNEMLDDGRVLGSDPNFGPTGRISTRVPTKGSGKNEQILPETYSGELTIDKDAMEAGGTIDKNMEFLATRRDQGPEYADSGNVPYFPGFKALEKLDPEARAEFVSAMQKENLNFIFEKLPKAFQDRSKLWYVGANRVADELSSKYGVPRSSMSGVIAALSPQMDWFQNASLAERVANAAINNRNFPWSSEMTSMADKYGSFTSGKNKMVWETIKGKTYADLETPTQKAMWIRAYDEAHSPKTYRTLTPEGDLGEIKLTNKGTPQNIGWGSFGDIEKAVKALESNGDFKIISDAMGNKHKVRNFFNNIEVPFSDFGDITIDTHAIAAGLMRPLGGNDTLTSQGLGLAGGSSAPTGAKGNYGFIADDYRDVAAERGFLPRETQSIVWEGVRALFNNKSPQAKRKVNAIWTAYDNGDLTQEQALNLIESEMGGFGDTKEILTPSSKRSIAKGGSTMFASGGLVLQDSEEQGFAIP